MPSIMAQDLVELLKQLLRGLPERIWHTFTTTDVFYHSIQVATNLTEAGYNTLLLSSGILFKRGEITMFSKAQLDHLQTALKGSMILSITRSQLQKKGKNSFFDAVGRSRYKNPSAQAKANPVLLPNRRGNGLNEAQLRLLARLCAERASTNEPELIVEEQLPLPPQMQDQYEQENEPPQADGQQPRPTGRRRVFQELHENIQSNPDSA